MLQMKRTPHYGGVQVGMAYIRKGGAAALDFDIRAASGTKCGT